MSNSGDMEIPHRPGIEQKRPYTGATGRVRVSFTSCKESPYAGVGWRANLSGWIA
jgi:hypothetical protein